MTQSQVIIQLRTFGHAAITTSDGSVGDALVSNSKRFALFCFLALPKPGDRHRRDTLLGVFWPELDQDRARANLRQSLAFIRRSLGDDVLIRGGDEEVGINSERVWCDAAEFQQAVERADWKEAIELYGGDFLKGLFLSNATEFEPWLERERARYAGAYCRALEGAASSAVSDLQWQQALAYCERLLEQDRFNSRYAMKLMEVMAAAGDPANALLYADEHAALLREELDIAVPSELADVTRRIRDALEVNRTGHIHQIAADVPSEFEIQAAPNGGTNSTDDMPGGAARTGRIVAAVTGAFVVAIAAVVVVTLESRDGGGTLDPDRVIVAEFRNETGDSTLDLLGRFAGHQVTQGVQQTGSVQVLPWETSLQAWLQVQEELGTGQALDPVQAFAEATGAGIVVTGTYYLENDRIRFESDVNDATRGQLVGSVEPAHGSRDSISHIVGRLQQNAMGLFAVRTDERLIPTFEVAGTPPSWDAYQAFDEGMQRYIRGQTRVAQGYFRRAIELHADYMDALVYLAITHQNLMEFAKLDSVLSELANLGERLTPYFSAYTESMQAYVDGDLERAVVAARRAAEMAPGSRAWHQLGVLCVWTNRPREAVEVYTALNPESPVVRGNGSAWGFLAGALHSLGEHERELEVARRFREVYPERVGWSLRLQAEALAAMGQIEDLESVLDELIEASNSYQMRRTLIHVAETLRADDRTEAADRTVDRAIEWFESRPLDEAAEEEHRRYYGEVLLLAERYHDAHEVFDGLVRDTEYPYLINYRGLRALAAVTLGDSVQAIEDEEWLAGVNPPYVRGHPVFWRAVVAGALGRREEAVSLLRRAFAEGMTFFWWTQEQTALKPLRGYPAFEELMRPKR